MNADLHAPRGARRRAVVAVVLGATLLCGGGGLWFVRDVMSMSFRATRTELYENVGLIRDAELHYQSAFDSFVAVPTPAPRPIEALDRQRARWPEDRDATPFYDLGFRPDGDVYGTYWVELTSDGQDFVVHGLMNRDDNGVPAHVIATRSRPPELLVDDY